MKKKNIVLTGDELEQVCGGVSDGDDIVDRVLRGDYGNGKEREDRLRAAGYDYEMVRKMVEERLQYSKNRQGLFD